MRHTGIRYYILAFFSGTAVLIIETIGVRVLAPYLGSAYVVWVDIVGVILAALAAGYWLGGVVADRTKKLLAPLFFLAAVAASLIPLERHLLPMLGEHLGIRVGSLIALRDDGILVMNVASSLEGPASAFFRALWKTCDGLFPQAAILATKKDLAGESQNIILLASKTKRPAFEEELAPFEAYRYRRAVFTADVPTLTDEFSPTDSLIEPLVIAYYPTLRANIE